MGLQKQYLYKISRNGVFLGVLQNVYSQFTYNQLINAAGTSMTIAVGTDPATSNTSVDTLATESGDDILTEDGDTMTTERAVDIVGNSNSKSLIRNYNDVKVYEFSPSNPNGKLVFNGYISKYTPNYGGNGIIEANVISYGAELDNYIILGSDLTDVTQATIDSTYTGSSYGKDYHSAKIFQSFIVGSGVTNVSAVEFTIAGATSADVGLQLQLDLYASQSDAQNGTGSLGNVQQAIVSTSATVQKFIFTAPLTVTPGATYYARLSAVEGILTNFIVSYAGTAPYANGFVGYSDGSVGGGGGGGWTTLTGDLYFKTYNTGGATSSAYSSQDPTAILRSIIDSYVNRGGTVNYGSGTTTLTALSVSYTFKVNTVLEGIKKCLDLAPYDWYFYVDPATNILYFKEASTTADHRMILGRHIEELNLETSIEQLKNVVYFSGGATAGVNLYTSLSSANSLATNNVGLARISDNRVTTQAAANALMASFLNENSAEQYNTTITILETTYDISSFSIGQMVGFGGFGNYVDGLLLQIVGLTRYPDSVQLKLGMIPPRATASIEDALKQINDLNTVNNPTTPS